MNEAPLRNMISRGRSGGGKGRDDMPYETLPGGMHVMGLVKIKQAERKSYDSEELEPVYRLVFRAREKPAAFVNLDCRPFIAEKSNLWKTILGMSGYKANYEDTDDTHFRTLNAFVGKWFMVPVQVKPWTNKQGQVIYFNKVAGAGSVLPWQDAAAVEDCNAYFEKKTGISAPKREQQISIQPVELDFRDEEIPF